MPGPRRTRADQRAFEERRKVWAHMNGERRQAAVRELKAVVPRLSIAEIADQLGASYYSIIGYVYRMKKGLYTPKDQHTIGNKDPLIREIFERAYANHITVKELAELAGYNQTTVGYLRQGRTTHPQFPMVVDLAMAVGLKLNWSQIDDEDASTSGNDA